MNSRHRMLTALDGGIPDHLPASVHDWMQHWLNKYLNGEGKIEAFEHFGLDWSIYEWRWNLDGKSLHNWEIKRVRNDALESITINTPEKNLHQIWQWDDFHTHWTTEFLLKEAEDIFIFLRWHPLEILDLDYERYWHELIGDRGILRGGRVGPWHKLCDLYGTEKMIYACFEDSQWVHEAMNALTEFELRVFETIHGTKTDLFETGGGHGSSTVISPDLFRDYILPYEKRIHAFLRDEIKIRTVYHTCGGMMPILDLLIEIGSTALETLTPPSMGGDVDLAEIKKRVGDKVALIGGFDQYNGFENATPEETRKQVRHCFETAGINGGYIMNPSDHFFEAPVENVMAYADEARKCVY